MQGPGIIIAYCATAELRCREAWAQGPPVRLLLLMEGQARYYLP